MKVIKKILLCVGMLSCLGANAADIEVADVFVQIVPHNNKAAAAFMRIENHTDKDIALVGGKSPISENTELDSLGLDSLDIAEVLINIEQSFSLPEVSTEELVDIKKVSDIVSLIDKYQK